MNEEEMERTVAAIRTAMHFCYDHEGAEREALFAELNSSDPVDWIAFVEKRGYVYTGDIMWEIKEG